MGDVRGKSWSDAERVTLLFAIAEANGVDFNKISWANVKAPEGRTVKACRHEIVKLREMVKQHVDGAAPSTPTTPKKRTKKDADDDDDEDEEKPAAKKKRAKAKAKTTVKEEPVDDDDAAAGDAKD